MPLLTTKAYTIGHLESWRVSTPREKSRLLASALSAAAAIPRTALRLERHLARVAEHVMNNVGRRQRIDVDYLIWRYCIDSILMYSVWMKCLTH